MITKQELIDFETEVAKEWEAGNLPFLIHLSGGNEDCLLEIFKDIKAGDWVLSTHRNHYHYLLKGGSPDRLMNMIKDGRSMFVFDKSINFLSSSVLAGTCGIAAGIAMAIREKGGTEKVWCFLGDGAEDEGHYYESVRYVESKGLPCKFIIEDNNRSVDASKELRGSKSIIKADCVIRYSYDPKLPHAGNGTSKKIEFNPEVVARFDNPQSTE